MYYKSCISTGAIKELLMLKTFVRLSVIKTSRPWQLPIKIPFFFIEGLVFGDNVDSMLYNQSGSFRFFWLCLFYRCRSWCTCFPIYGCENKHHFFHTLQIDKLSEILSEIHSRSSCPNRICEFGYSKTTSGWYNKFFCI